MNIPLRLILKSFSFFLAHASFHIEYDLKSCPLGMPQKIK